MALILFLLVGMGVVATIALSLLKNSNPRLEHDQKTQLALMQAKEALIAYAASTYLVGNNRPGDLPCPDSNNDGKKETSCGNASGTTAQAKRLGRLPWKDLGLADLRDASGERLWYAVSNNFKENARHFPLNSDTTGTIQVAEANGTIIPDAIAVIIAPGAPLQRLNSASVQDRSPIGENDPVNYLDQTSTEDNANFLDGTANGFINGIVSDAQGRLLVNDTMLVITYSDLMPLLEKQVAATVFNCLNAYASYNDGISNNWGRYPWPASMATSAAGNFADTPNTLFGRIPDQMCFTGGDGASELACKPTVGTNPQMLSSWGAVPGCTIGDAWFQSNWREQVFYAIADPYKPGAGIPSCGPSCLRIGTNTSVKIAVFLSRRSLSGQNRTNKAIIGNYLEAENSTPYDSIFESNALSASFNDLLVFK